MTPTLTHAEIIEHGARNARVNYSAQYGVTEPWNRYGERVDWCGIVNFHDVICLEAKVSREDFIRDRVSKIRLGCGHYRVYVTIPGVVFNDAEIPEGWGWWLLQHDQECGKWFLEEKIPPARIEMDPAGWMQVVLYYAQLAKPELIESKGKPGKGKWDDVIEILHPTVGLPLRQIAFLLKFDAGRKNAFRRAAERGELPPEIVYDRNKAPWEFTRASE